MAANLGSQFLLRGQFTGLLGPFPYPFLRGKMLPPPRVLDISRQESNEAKQFEGAKNGWGSKSAWETYHSFLPPSCVSAPGKPTKKAKVFPHCCN